MRRPLLILVLLAGHGLAQTGETLPDPHLAGDTYAERSAALVRYLAVARPANPDFPKEAAPYYAARLQLGVDRTGTLDAIDRMLDATRKAKPDPFNLHAVMHTYLLHRDQFTPAMREKVKALAASWDYSKPIGVSMNYELMRDGSGYLAAQEWPDLTDAAGNNAAAISKNCSSWLMRVFRETTAHNASEYDAPVYYGTDFAPARMIAEFGRDPTLAMAAQMTLEFMLVQTGAHWLHGYHISTAGRGKYWGSLMLGPDSAAPTNGMAFLFFGSSRPFDVASAPQTYWLAHPGHALPPTCLSDWQAALPDHRTVLASHLMVRKIAWFSAVYGLASQREDGIGPENYLFKECRRTMLKWRSDQPQSTFTVLQENRRRPTENIANAFAYGENPYCQVMQDGGTLIGAFDVPEGYGHWITRAPFTIRGAIVLRRERDGWVLCHGGTMMFAFRFTGPSYWDAPNAREGLDLLRCDARRGGWILETTPLAPFAGGGAKAELDRFADALASRTTTGGDTAGSPPRLVFKNLLGHTLDLTWHPAGEPYGGQCRLDGAVVDYSKFPLLSAPGALQADGGPLKLTLPDGSKRTLDFSKWIITGTPK